MDSMSNHSNPLRSSFPEKFEPDTDVMGIMDQDIVASQAIAMRLGIVNTSAASRQEAEMAAFKLLPATEPPSGVALSKPSSAETLVLMAGGLVKAHNMATRMYAAASIGSCTRSLNPASANRAAVWNAFHAAELLEERLSTMYSR